MTKPNLVTGSLYTPAWDQYVDFTANISNGSSTISSISNVNLLYVGLVLSNAHFSAGTTVVSVNYIAGSAVLSSNSDATLTGETFSVVFQNGQYYLTDASFYNINGTYNNLNITNGFQIVNQATAPGVGL